MSRRWRTSRHLRRSLVLVVAAVVTAAVTAQVGAAPVAPSRSSGSLLGSNRADVSMVESDGAIEPRHMRHHARHRFGAQDGGLPAGQGNVQLLGKAQVSNPESNRVADVTVKGNYAYASAWFTPDCVGGGVYVFDIADLTNPRQVGFIPTGEGAYVGEGQDIITLDTPAFRGDVLVFQNELCGLAETSVGGVTLVDVRDPTNPVVLANGFGDLEPEGAGPGIAHQVHSAFAWTAGGRAYVVAVDNEEEADVDIFEITDPRNPVKVAEHAVAATWPQILQPNAGLEDVFFHDVVVKRIDGRQIMLLSYWDAGYVLLDVTDPANPTLVADSDFANPDPELLAQTGKVRPPEGNAHEAEFTKDNRYIVAADEDFGSSTTAGATDDGTTFEAFQGTNTRPILDGVPMTGTAVYVGRACDSDPPVPAPPATGGPFIAISERGGDCFNTERAANIEAVTENGGYAGIVIANREGSCGPIFLDVAGGLQLISVDRKTGFSYFDIEDQYDDAACLAGDGTVLMPVPLGTVGDVVTASADFNGWGYLHVYRNGTGKLREVDTFALPEAMDPLRAAGSGTLSVHEVATSHRRSDLVYSAYYAGGFRVLKIKNGKLQQVGSFLEQGGNDFWGVEVFSRNGKEYVAASDRDFGLYIFRYTGP